MSNDYFNQLKSACAEGDIENLDKLLIEADQQLISLNELLILIRSCLRAYQWPQVYGLFNKALSVKKDLNAELQHWLTLPELNDQLEVKQKLIDQAVKAQTHLNGLLALGLFYRDSDLFTSAEQLFLQLIEHVPGDIRAYHRLITVYIRTQRYHDAIACCQLALNIDARSVTALYNFGVANVSLNRESEALEKFNKTLEIAPDNHWAHLQIAQIQLKQGNFTQGWQQYEWRKVIYQKKANDLATVYPEWTGQNLEGKSILVWADQGLGDIIMYAGFFKQLLRLGCTLSVMAEPRLKNIFERSFSIQYFYPELITSEQQIKHRIDYQIPISGLGARFVHSFSDFSAQDSYLRVDQTRSEKIKNTLMQQASGKRLVGLSWRGGVVDTRKHARCIPLEKWRFLFKRKDCVFVNLQYDSNTHESSQFSQWGGINLDLNHKQDIDGVASALNTIDLLISVDNSSAHFAGALGTEVWNLLPYSGEWRWFLDSEKSYWYQSMRLFRQKTPDDWAYSLASIYQALTNKHVNKDSAVG
ncbi:MAG: hypothetical protein JKY66_10580 [Spongiibacteraceae bacterium]|nr:hypothetical protein [Spongiibacteraceae bacterium]